MNMYTIGKPESDGVLTEIVRLYEAAFPNQLRGYYRFYGASSTSFPG